MRPISAAFKIEKRLNNPDVIYFQFEDKEGFFKPKYIYVAFSDDEKKEYKASSSDEIELYIKRMKHIINFKRNEWKYGNNRD